jgi:GNAT superfamily N-acetyltransferase
VGLVSAPERRHHAPDRTLLLVRDGSLAARCSCWWTGTALLEGRPLGAIGHYAAADGPSAHALLGRACHVLQQAGVAVAVGPLDGTTWRRYRFVVERGSEPPFVLEPDNPDDWPLQWRRAGFEELALYTSALVDEIPGEDPRLTDLEGRIAAAGIEIRPFDVRNVETELARIHTLSLEAFPDNFLYTPIERAEFVAQYHAVLPHVRPELVLLAERGADLVGFMFALPNLVEAHTGRPVRSVVLKTLAVSPAARGAGLGTLLLARAQVTARSMGLTRAIHALIHERNVSRRISDRYARTIRRYALYAKRVAP